MTRLMSLKQEKADAVKRMREILDGCEERKAEMTAEEDAEYKSLDASLDKINEKIAREERLAGIEGSIEDRDKPKNPLPNFVVGKNQTYDPEKEFKNLGEMADCMANRPHDPRLIELREQTMGTGTQGGYAIPEQWSGNIWGVGTQAGIIRPRATVIPAGSPPDAKLTMPALDQTSGSNMFGGVTLVHTGEGITMTETGAKLKEVSWEPKEISGYVVATNKLLNNWDAATTFLTTQLRAAMAAQEDYDFLRGSGVNMALGIINSPAAIAYTRNTASDVKFSDIYGMIARMKMGGSPIWIASQTIIPSLAAMVDAGSHAVWLGGALMGSARDAMPSTLFGYPIYFSDRLPTLGTKGDLMFIDPSYYVVKDGSGPFLSWSEHVYFLSNKSAVKIVWNVDGKAWLIEPLILEGTTASTVSPFVILN